MYNGNPSGYNPFAPNTSFNYGAPPKYDIITVSGRAGAEALQMAPNSKVLLLDERPDSNLIWLAQTDGAGYKTITPFLISAYVEQPPIDTNELNNRVTNIEQMLTSLTASMEELRHEKSHFKHSSTKQYNNKSKQQSNRSADTTVH